MDPDTYSKCKGSVAEWSKALVLGTSLFGGAGSNPAAAKYTVLGVTSPLNVPGRKKLVSVVLNLR